MKVQIPLTSWIAVALVLVMVTPPRAAGSAADTVYTQLDSLATRYLGVWSSSADPRDAVVITLWPSNVLRISVGERFEAVGFIAGDEGIFLVQAPAARRSGRRTTKVEILRLRHSAPGQIEAHFADDLTARSSRHEVWHLVRRFGEPAPPDSASADSARAAPKLGEFVYVEELPEAVEKVPPDYPEWARKKNIEGTVLVQALVGRNGTVRQVVVVKSIPELDDYAIAAVKQWRFRPAQARGEPIAVWVAIPVKFSLR